MTTFEDLAHQQAPATEGKKIPKKILEILFLLENSPSGLASKQISYILRGISQYSAHSEEITQARIAATRKQIQRARFYLNKINSEKRLLYCCKGRVWRTVHSQTLKRRPINLTGQI